MSSRSSSSEHANIFTKRGTTVQQERQWSARVIATLVAINIGLAGMQLYVSFFARSIEELPPYGQFHVEEIGGIERAETRAALRRNLLTNKQKSTEKTTIDSNENNPNVGEPSLSYKPSYHYTSPQQPGSYFMKHSTASKFHDSETFNPQIAWLTSFPNSGTSFTMGLVARATNATFATNYGIEANFGSKEVPSTPIYPRHKEGPFMPSIETSYHHRRLPYGRYVLTKTHCGGYCFNCAPRTYAYGYQENDVESGGEMLQYQLPPPGLSFLGDCASGHAVDERGNIVDVSYPPERVARVIHLIRNPMHNMIARFHLERKHHSDANTTSDLQWLEEHPDNDIGMSKFCQEANDRRRDDETKFFESDFFRPSDDETETETTFSRRNGDSISPTESRFPKDFEAWKKLARRVPCRGDLFRYVQWHNLLHQSLDYLPYKLPVLTLHYEGFESPSYEATANSILDFLEQKAVPDEKGNIKWSEFHSRSDYDSFFSAEQTKDIQEFLQTLSSFRVWGEIEHYFQ